MKMKKKNRSPGKRIITDTGKNNIRILEAK